MGEQDHLRQALALTTAALQAAVASGQVHPSAKLTLTGSWAHLGSAAVSEILDRANAALGAARSTTANIDSLPEQPRSCVPTP
ncbi:hypothetical protein F1D61_30945 [Methylobacterium aquaticum]|nr:hypothetical protein F1D61_30945 [Methylobacterium aquaticum]